MYQQPPTWALPTGGLFGLRALEQTTAEGAASSTTGWRPLAAPARGSISCGGSGDQNDSCGVWKFRTSKQLAKDQPALTVLSTVCCILYVAELVMLEWFRGNLG